MKAFILHGAYGHPNENWIPWLKQKLEHLKLEVITPVFPTPEGQNLENWRKIMDSYKIEECDIFVAHSISPAFVLDLLERHKIKAAFFVAPFVKKLNDPIDEINVTFYKNFNWEKINQNCKHFVIFYSDNDPYVSMKHSEEVAHKLKTIPTLIKGAGHFNEKAGYLKFELLLKKIKEIT